MGKRVGLSSPAPKCWSWQEHSARKTGRGNGGRWKARKTKRRFSLPSHRRDGDIVVSNFKLQEANPALPHPFEIPSLPTPPRTECPHCAPPSLPTPNSEEAEFRSREMLQKLVEQAGNLYHNDAFLEASDRTDGYRFTHSLRLHRRAYRLQRRVKPNSLRPTVPSIGRLTGD